ncbi:hypothetical protein C7M84_007321 [Penaeus vannamei]|uniref:Cuticle protein 6 n=1 Tax=Penaeus vannamei TaxID=6689 RepID=A0A423TCL3_PENVA|nr:hypothetical protein C7M84_007321 [Penaeus vannamei]
MSLGRRYHPAGIPKIAPDNVLIPKTASFPPPVPRSGSGKQLVQTFRNPNFQSFEVSSETPDDLDDFVEDALERAGFDDDDLDDDDDDLIFRPESFVNMYNDQTSEHRLALSENLLGTYYHNIDTQGSIHWNYKLEDQFQDHTVHRNGNMEGKFGWTAPGGQEVRVQYIADEGGYRVLSSQGIHPVDSDEVEEAKRLHFLVHKNLANQGRGYGTGAPAVPFPVGGKPLPGVGGPGTPAGGSAAGGSPFSPAGPGAGGPSSDPCLLLGKQHPSLVPEECRIPGQFGADGSVEGRLDLVPEEDLAQEDSTLEQALEQAEDSAQEDSTLEQALEQEEDSAQEDSTLEQALEQVPEEDLAQEDSTLEQALEQVPEEDLAQEVSTLELVEVFPSLA